MKRKRCLKIGGGSWVIRQCLRKTWGTFCRQWCEHRYAEQLVLAQNQMQHSKTLLRITPIYAPSALVKHLNPFFLSDHERVLLIDIEIKGSNVDNMWLLRNTLYVNSQKLETVFLKVRKFSTWFDRAYPLRLSPRKGQK